MSSVIIKKITFMHLRTTNKTLLFEALRIYNNNI